MTERALLDVSSSLRFQHADEERERQFLDSPKL